VDRSASYKGHARALAVWDGEFRLEREDEVSKKRVAKNKTPKNRRWVSHRQHESDCKLIADCTLDLKDEFEKLKAEVSREVTRLDALYRALDARVHTLEDLYKAMSDRITEQDEQIGALLIARDNPQTGAEGRTPTPDVVDLAQLGTCRAIKYPHMKEVACIDWYPSGAKGNTESTPSDQSAQRVADLASDKNTIGMIHDLRKPQ
jgi:hypothetical protein